MYKFKKVYNFIAADRQMVSDGGSFSFRAYTDKAGAFGAIGTEVIYNEGQRDRQTGRAVGKLFVINHSHNNLQAREEQTDIEKKSLADFLLNTPFTEGSPNGVYQYADGGFVSEQQLDNRDLNIERIRSGEIKQLGVKLKLMDADGDAKVALEAGVRRAKAQLSASEIDKDTLKEVAAHIGVFGEPNELMRHAVYDWAGKRPIDYFKILESGDRTVRSLVRKAIEDKIFTHKGSVIFWENTIIGNNEDDAVAFLLGNKQLLDGLQEKIDLKVQVKAAETNKGGRPRKDAR